jgi:hypothetical protein
MSSFSWKESFSVILRSLGLYFFRQKEIGKNLSLNVAEIYFRSLGESKNVTFLDNDDDEGNVTSLTEAARKLQISSAENHVRLHCAKLSAH